MARLLHLIAALCLLGLWPRRTRRKSTSRWRWPRYLRRRSRRGCRSAKAASCLRDPVIVKDPGRQQRPHRRRLLRMVRRMQRLLIDWTCSTRAPSRPPRGWLTRRSRTRAPRQRRHPLCHSRSAAAPTRPNARCSTSRAMVPTTMAGWSPDIRYEALKERIVINGLPIMNDRLNPFGSPSEADLDKYCSAARAPSSRSRCNFDDFPRPHKVQAAPQAGWPFSAATGRGDIGRSRRLGGRHAPRKQRQRRRTPARTDDHWRTKAAAGIRAWPRRGRTAHPLIRQRHSASRRTEPQPPHLRRS